MTKHKKIILTLALTLVLSAVFVCGICVGAGASGTSQQITATLEPGLTVTVDGTAQQFFDANGSRVYPILYNGSTYLPLRAVCEQVAGFTVGWDQATRTASITTRDVDGVDLINAFKPYTDYNNLIDRRGFDNGTEFRQSADNQTASYGGVDLNHWIFMWNGQYIEGRTSHTSFNVGGKYDKLTFRAYAQGDGVLTVYGDNESVLAQFELAGGQLNTPFTVDLMKTSQLTFSFQVTADKEAEYGSGIAIFDTVLTEAE